MIEIEDLMIGDWIMVDGKPYKYYAPELDMDNSLSGGLWIVDPNGIHYYTGSEDAIPIPLTNEILEKNDFEYQEGKIGAYGVTTASYYKYENSPNIFCDGNPFAVWFEDEVNIQYVHQLQHILKMCHIEKNIIL